MSGGRGLVVFEGKHLKRESVLHCCWRDMGRAKGFFSEDDWKISEAN